jgi:hypothetical protein
LRESLRWRSDYRMPGVQSLDGAVLLWGVSRLLADSAARQVHPFRHHPQ